MKTKLHHVLQLFIIVIICSCSGEKKAEISSPDGTIDIKFELQDGQPRYSVNKSGNPVILSSKMGFRFQNMPDFRGPYTIENEETREYDSTWTQVWGEKKTIREHYNHLIVTIKEQNNPGRKMLIHFKAFDDGIGFRYEMPKQEGVGKVNIAEELTEFALSGDHTSWWIPANEGYRYENLYRNTPVSHIDTVHTPVTMKVNDSLYLSIHEAALTDFASFVMHVSRENTLGTSLIGWKDGIKVKTSAPFVSPWRTIQIAEKPAGLINSYLILNLNEPNVIEDVSWIKPAKYMGIWWEMHIGVSSWGTTSEVKHGATTENAKKYIDFAAKHGIQGVLVEGWNTGWDDTWWKNGNVFSFTEPFTDYDLEGVTGYAKENGVEMIAHNETSAVISNYERQMKDAYKLYQELGIHYIKSGYVGDEFENGEPHHGQYAVNHFRKVVKIAAEYHINMNVHEPIKATGIRRTYPNMMTREGARGMEFNAWDKAGGNPPSHTCILPFTRLLGGPLDYTPGIFNILLPEKPGNRVNTTLAKQLALYVTIFSPLHMAADLPENYERYPDAFQFIKDVPVDWEDTKALNGEIGEYLTIARKDRNSQDWYIGSITNEKEREFSLKLDFLEPETNYTAQVYADGEKANWANNPLDIKIYNKNVNSNTNFTIKLAPGGGMAVRFIKETDSY